MQYLTITIDVVFPYWFQNAYLREINIKGNSFDKITKEEGDIAWDKYQELVVRKKVFNYLKTGNGYVLTLNKKDVENRNNERLFQLFLNFLITEENNSLTNLCGKISFDFYGYNSDEREIFEIDEIREWFKITKKYNPELFYYIDSRSVINQRMIVLPVFVKCYRMPNENNMIKVKYDENDFDRFLKEECETITLFCIKNDLTEAEKIFTNFK